MSSFCSAKATHIFSAKNIRILYIESAKTVNEMTLNELVKLTTLRTTGPRSACACAQSNQSLRCPPESDLDVLLPTRRPAMTDKIARMHIIISVFAGCTLS